MLTSPAEGLSVPSTATTSSGQKVVRLAKPTPVASIIAAAPSRRCRRATRCPARPSSIVSAADPSRVPVTMAPTSNGVNPRASRWPARSTLTKPSTNPRSARANRMRRASPVVLRAVTIPSSGERPARATGPRLCRATRVLEDVLLRDRMQRRKRLLVIGAEEQGAQRIAVHLAEEGNRSFDSRLAFDALDDPVLHLRLREIDDQGRSAAEGVLQAIDLDGARLRE